MPGMVPIGKLRLAFPFFQAGLAGYSDAAMRLIARRHGAPYAITEAMLDLFLLNGGKGLKAAELDELDHPIAGQLMGSHPLEIAAGAKVLVSLGYDVIDVNLACPVKKIRRKCRGGHLLQAPDEAIAILDAVRQAVPPEIPCTVKLRRGTDDSPEAEANFFRIFEGVVRLGYAAATVHGRTVEQKYVGPSRWAFLADLTRRYPQSDSFSIFGSGDIWEAPDIYRMVNETGVRAASVARGCIGNPWIFAQARAIHAGDAAGGSRPPTIEEQKRVLLDHFDLSVRVHGERGASMNMRKFGIKFSRHHHDPLAVKQAFIAVKNTQEWRDVIERLYVPAEVSAVVSAEPATA
ncbi:MAG: tRNA-dihydrouridine synthase [Planctomycetota bacterium]|nr:tRNA-dihydrouridine synthase [Planctomycetota bacterium]